MRAVLSVDCLLIEALRTAIPGASNRTLRQMLQQGRVRINGRLCRVATDCLRAGDVLEIGQRQLPVRERSDLEVIYEDECLIIVNKPAGLLSVSTPHERYNTLQALLRRHLRERKRTQGLHIVHRLDKHASGLLVLAKSEPVQQKLKRLFEKHTIERRYWAIVEGHVEHDSGTIRSRLLEDSNFHVRSTKDPAKGKAAVTHYRVLRHFPGLTAVEITLETGRKNQIRAHMSEFGHPIAGDRSYGSTVNPVGRLALHAYCLGFMHPTDGRALHFETEPPPEFRPYL